MLIKNSSTAFYTVSYFVLQHDDCTFDGFIRVHMNLNRPVNISSDTSNLTLKKAVQKSKRPLSNSRRPVSELFPTAGTMGTSNNNNNNTDTDSGVGSQSSTLSSVDAAVLSASANSRKSKVSVDKSEFYAGVTFQVIFTHES